LICFEHSCDLYGAGVPFANSNILIYPEKYFKAKYCMLIYTVERPYYRNDIRCSIYIEFVWLLRGVPFAGMNVF